jgi:uncharacterized protein
MKKTAAILILSLTILGASVYAKNPQRVIFTSHGKSHTIELRVAKSPRQRAQGLMHSSLKPHEGMLFIFDTMGHRSFWMKNTPMSLDLIYLNDRGEIVAWHLGAEPYSLSHIRIKTPFRYTIEVLAGTVKTLGLKRGLKPQFIPPL